MKIGEDKNSQSSGIMTEKVRQEPVQDASEKPSQEPSDEYYLEQSN